MRIHSGEARGRVLKTREGKGTRPTDARAREALFNIIGERVVQARVLDLYAGTGAVGLEALSRGAAFCVLVEQNAGACRVIRDNVKLLGWSARAQVWQSAVRPALRRLGEPADQSGRTGADNSDDSERAAQHQASESGASAPNTSAAPGASTRNAHFDIVFADPPFTRPEELRELAAGLDNFAASLENRRAHAARLLIIQHHRKADLSLSPRFEAVQQRRAGESLLSFYRLANAGHTTADAGL